ncbi:MAG: biopolymer transporter ExbD [bacterium]
MRRRRLAFMAEMNMTSLADVSFSLMIIFLIAGVSSAIARRQGVDLDLPRASTIEPQHKSGLEISIQQDGTIFVDRQRTTRTGFPKALGDQLGRREYDRVYLRADRNVDYGLVMFVIGRVREQGIVNIGLVALPER